MKSITPQDACNLLNKLLEIDYGFTAKLVTTRFVCTQDISRHPTVQINERDGITEAGIIGVINGMFGKREDGTAPICYQQDENGEIIKFTLTP